MNKLRFSTVSPNQKRPYRFQFSMRLLLVLALLVACVTGFLVAYGPTILWATTHVYTRKFAAMREYQLVATESGEEIVHCRFGELRFSMPSTLWQNLSVFRAPDNSVWLKFADQQRMISIPISSMTTTPFWPVFQPSQMPYSLKSMSTPKLIKTALATSTDDLSVNMTREKLKVHDWALTQRPLLGLDDRSMIQYAMRCSGRADLIVVDADPISIDSAKRLRSIIHWEATNRSHSGQFWFGDATQARVNWIEAFALSFDFVASESSPKLSDLKNGSMSDDQLLEMLQVDPNQQPQLE